MSTTLDAILQEINGDKEMTNRFVYIFKHKNFKDAIAKVVDKHPYVNNAADVYDVLVCERKNHLPKALRDALVARFGDIEYEKEWANDAELHKALTEKGITHPDAYAPACFILHRAFPNETRSEIAENLRKANVVIRHDMPTADDIVMVADIAPKSDEVRRQLLALIEAFHPNNGKSIAASGSVISRYKFSFTDVVDIMSKLNCANTAEAEAKLSAIEAEHAQEITCAQDFIKFIS